MMAELGERLAGEGLRVSDAAGLIAREPIDRKSLAIVLTDAGETKLGRVRKIIARFETALIDKVPEPHRDHLLPALNALWGQSAQ